MLFKTSTVFKENLEQFPSIAGVEKIDFYLDGNLQGTVANVEGQKGSLALYFYLFKTMGVLDTSAARRGLELFAEHTASARATPGAHPNIDRLILIEATHQTIEMKVTYAEGNGPTSAWDEEQDDK